MQAAFPNARVGNGFGLTETSSVSTYLPDEYAAEHADSVGFAGAGGRAGPRRRRPGDRGGRAARPRAERRGRATGASPSRPPRPFVDGWLHTGDLARIDDDGFVQIVDRKKDMVNRGGENVYCVEVENALVRHPDVFEVAVLGVPDVMMGEKVGAVVVPRPGVELVGRAAPAWAAPSIADFKVPQYIAFRSEPLPRNAGGKVLKPVLRDETDWGAPLR